MHSSLYFLISISICQMLRSFVLRPHHHLHRWKRVPKVMVVINENDPVILIRICAVIIMAIQIGRPTFPEPPAGLEAFSAVC